MMIAFVAIAFLVGYFVVTFVMNKVEASDRREQPKHEVPPDDDEKL
jgi:large-conductance mechanosensitive channel